MRPAPATEQKSQHKPRRKSANVRHISDTTRIPCTSNRTDAAEKLQDNPKPNDYQCRYLNDLSALQHFDSALGEQQNVSTQYPRNRS
jgi:hypothetical protein